MKMRVEMLPGKHDKTCWGFNITFLDPPAAAKLVLVDWMRDGKVLARQGGNMASGDVSYTCHPGDGPVYGETYLEIEIAE